MVRLSLRAVGASIVTLVLGAPAAVSGCESRSSQLPAQPVPGNLAMSSSSKSASSADRSPAQAASRGLLSARPGTPRQAALATGETRLGLGAGRDGFVYVPARLPRAGKVPLLVFLHGAGGSAQQAASLRPFADRYGVPVLAVDSRRRTWDLLEGELGPDVAFLDRALAWTFERVDVEPERLVLSGFSDGASYALSLGLANGSMFKRILAFSPGFVAAPERNGTPRLFVSHGKNDDILPIDPCSRRIVRRLSGEGYGITYREFDGSHTVPPVIADAAFAWFLA